MSGSEAEPIAVIGIASRFADDAVDPQRLWRYLLQGRSAMRPFPPHKLNADAHYHPNPDRGGMFYTKGGHFLAEDISRFDAAFFNFTKNEVLCMDPQQRLLLENVYEGLENAGIPIDECISSDTSVYVGSFADDYRIILDADFESWVKYKGTGCAKSILANRISWFFDFSGASVTIDTACSSGLVAVHLACQNLRLGDSKMAIASGVNLITHPYVVNDLSKLGALSPDGLCYTFDERANGYSRGEGVGTVIMKRLSDAVKDGDTIRGLIRATGCNQDGKTQGIFVPSMQAQQRLIRETYRKAGLDLKSTAYVEAHGTGTAVGDPIEVEAIATTFKDRPRDSPLYIGAVKTSLGHTEGAAGMLSLIKALLVVEAGIIPPNLNFRKVNPRIHQKEWNVAFPLEAIPWPQPGPRIASANSFGFGGTNAHVIISDAHSYLTVHRINGIHRTAIDMPSFADVQRLSGPLTLTHTNGRNGTRNNDQQDKPFAFVFSAFDKGGVERVAQSYRGNLMSQQGMLSNHSAEQDFLNDLAYTLACRRSLFSWRATCRASTVADLVHQLQSLKVARVRNQNSVIAFVFTGRGAQWLGMGKSLINFPVFRRSLEEASEYTLRVLGSPWRLIDVALGEESYDITRPSLSQPLCTALQVAAVELLASWNIFPRSVVGHSSGEIAAAYAAGKLGRKAAWKIAYYRGVVSESFGKRGSMMAVGLREEDLQPYMEKVVRKDSVLSIACFNAPTNLTVSSDEDAIDSLKALLDEDKIFARKLNVANAYHSRQMKIVEVPYHRLLGDIWGEDKLNLKHPVAMFSSVTGMETGSKVTETASYWVKNLLSPVRFSSALLAMSFGTSDSINEIIEVGPHSALQSAIRDTLNGASIIGVEYSRILARNDTSSDILLETAAALWQRGYPVNMGLLNEHLSGKSGKLLTSLPAYSFNHETEYWKESRLSSNYRFRQHPRMDLVGAPVPDWNPHEPKWRQVFRLSEIPWLADHKVTDNIVYPGVGYLIMALEAAKQSANPNLRLTGFRFRDITIQTALIIPDTADGIETMLSLSGVSESFKSRSKVWNEFHVYSYDDMQKEWRVHCRGEISLEYKKHSDVPSEACRNSSNLLPNHLDLDQGLALCQRPFDTTRHYEKSAKNGIQYGPTFRTVSNVKLGPQGQRRGIATGVVSITDLASVMPNGFLYPHTVQPATLDCMLQMVYPAVLDFKGAEAVDEPLVPTLFREVWISADISNTPGHQFRCHSQVERIGASDFRTVVSVWDEGGSSMMVQFKDAELTHIDVSTVHNARELCHNIRWRPDVDFVTSDFFKAKALPELNEAVTSIFRRLQVVSAILIQDAVKELSSFDDAFELLPHHQKYSEWLKTQDETIRDSRVALFDQATFDQCNSDAAFREALFRETMESGPNGRFMIKIGSQIIPILRREVDPLHLMFGEDDGQLMDSVYREEFELGHLPAHFASYLDLLSHRGGDLKFLEVGAGTGGTTLPILETMCPPDDPDSWTIREYAYTDISPGFFEKAAEKFKSWESILKFKTFNAETDPSLQQFSSEDKYDVIVAGNVIHATADIQATLRRLHRLLKPGGRLIMQEIVQPSAMFASLGVGVLPGWWLATESFRQSGPLLREEEWDSVLRDSGFSGTDVLLRDSHSDSHISSIIISKALDKTETGGCATSPVYVVETSPETAGESPAHSLSKVLLKEHGLENCQAVNFGQLSGLPLEDACCVVLVDGQRSFLLNLSESGFADLMHLLNNCVRIFWVTKGTDNPTFAMAKGVLRTTRWETHTADTNIVTLDIDTAGEKTSAWSEYHAVLSKVFAHEFLLRPVDSKGAEYELRQGSVLYTSRLYRHEQANAFISSLQGGSPKDTLQAWGQEPTRPLKLHSAMPGNLDSLRFIDDPVAVEPLGDFEVEIEIRAAGLNFRDIMIGMGEISHDCFGFEGAGIVRSIGSKVDRLNPGDRVTVVTGTSKMGCIQRFFRAPQESVVKIPDTMSFETAASLPCNFVTVLYSLRDLARLCKGESVLIHAGAGGTGQAAIQYANMVGAEVFTTVSTPEKKRLLMENYGVKEDHIFSSRNTDFAASVLRATGGRGVDVVLNSLSGEALRRSWDCIAPLGRFIELGKKDIAENGRLHMRPFDLNATFCSVDISVLGNMDPARAGRLLADSLKIVEAGGMQPPTPLTMYSFANVTTAFRQLQTGKAMGKIVLVPGENDIVPVLSPPLIPHRFEEDATYVLSGGLGGLGRSIARWMVSRGARNLVFFSRSGAKSKPAEKLVRELENQGCRVVVAICDVSNEDSMRRALDGCKTLPPIRGCIQAAMQLKDMTLGTMTFNDYTSVIRPKVVGSWNLHNLLPKDLDFFIMLSSVSGVVGNRGQANYNAGNTYQDELARFRVKQGLKATTIDLGSLTAVGYISENWVDTMQLTPMLNLLSMSMLEVSVEELLAILEFYMHPQSTPVINSADDVDEGLFGCAAGLHTAESLRDADKEIPPYMESALWAKMRTISPLRALRMSGDVDNKHLAQSLTQKLGSAQDIDAAAGIVIGGIRDKLSSMISIPADDIDVSKALSSYGVDSLVAIEFRTWVMKDIGAEIPVLELIGSSSISALASRIAAQSRYVKLS